MSATGLETMSPKSKMLNYCTNFNVNDVVSDTCMAEFQVLSGWSNSYVATKAG